MKRIGMVWPLVLALVALVVFAAATLTVKGTISLFLPLMGEITWICDV